MDLKDRVIAQFWLGKNSAHGPDHWQRVEHYGLYLAAHSGADPEIVRHFALIHDSQRRQEGPEPEHGPRAADYARSLGLDLTPQRLELLARACYYHEMGQISSDPTVGTCWDADRLDLDRVGITPDPDFMSTVQGRRLSLMRPYDRQKLAGIVS